MIKKRSILILFLEMIIIQCEDNIDSQDSSKNYGIEITYIKDEDNIDRLGNASGSTIRMVDDCSYVGVGHRAGVPWIIKFNELGEQVWDKRFDEIHIPQGNYGTGLIYATAVDKTYDGGFVIVCATTINHLSYNAPGRILKVDSSSTT